MSSVVFQIIRVFYITILAISALTIVYLGSETIYQYGYVSGYQAGANEALGLISSSNQAVLDTLEEEAIPKGTPTAVVVERNPVHVALPNWTGPELWEAVNTRRQQLGVNSLGQRDELCTIASIRLNELLALGTLDGHAGFSKLPQEREDLRWIFDKYNLSEFLLSGAQTPAEAVSLWENTLGHKKLLTGGEYVWGCIYAQNSFAVAITAY